MPDDDEIPEDDADLADLEDLEEEPADLDDDLDPRPRRTSRTSWTTDDDAVVARRGGRGRGRRGGRRRSRPSGTTTTSDDEDEEEADPDDVEADLDAILKDRIAAAEEEEDDEEEEAPEPEERRRRHRSDPAEAPRRVRLPVLLPRQAPQPARRREAQALRRLRLTTHRPPERRLSDVPCAPCGEPLPRSRRAFCPSCGAAVGGLAAGERRVVTVAFADLAGFTTMAEGRDPETVKDLLDDCFGALVPVIDAHGGTVDKIIGDELMAVWGAPRGPRGRPGAGRAGRPGPDRGPRAARPLARDAGRHQHR